MVIYYFFVIGRGGRNVKIPIENPIEPKFEHCPSLTMVIRWPVCDILNFLHLFPLENLLLVVVSALTLIKCTLTIFFFYYFKQNNRRVKRIKYALLREDWGLLEAKSTFEVAPNPMIGQTKTPVEVRGCTWKRRPLAIKWDGWVTKVLPVESDGVVEVNPPVDEVKCVLPEMNEP